MRLQQLVDVSSAVADTRSRLEKTAKLAELLTQLRPEEIRVAVAYLSGSLRQGRVGVGWSSISHASTSPPSSASSLELVETDAVFDQIGRTTGAGAARAREQRLAMLFSRATRGEQDFLVRLISGDLRQGALEGVLADAVAKAAKTSLETIRTAAMMCGDLGEVAQTALVEGPSALTRYGVQLFRPVEPMLASPAGGVAEALAWLGESAFELKLDGARIQAHKSGGDVRIYSRGLRDVTAAVPEVAEQLRAVAAREMILDGEVIALRSNGRPHPFQDTMRRFGRRLEVERLRNELPVTPFFFDCLYLDGRSQIAEPQRSRFATLLDTVPEITIEHRILSDREECERFLREALERGHEGLMAKALDAPYAAGSRGRGWLKIKHARTLDLVVLAAEWGSGRRKGWLSNLHLGARDPAGGPFVMLGKTFKGLTDEMLEWQTAVFLEREVRREGHIVFVRPEIVVEIAFNDLQESPHYPAGLALRFARVKGYRPDKSAGESDTIETVEEIYHTMTGKTPPRRA